MTFFLTVLGVVLAAVGIIVSLKQRGDRPAASRRPVPRIRRWRKCSFPIALSYLEDYVEAKENIPPPDKQTVDQAVLESWGVHLLLTAASVISPYSQGKANLFVAHQRTETKLTLRSKYFVGAFPLWQLKDRDHTYRDMDVPTMPGASLREVSVAGRAALGRSIQFRAVADQLFRSEPEKELKATHILGIPIHDGAERTKPNDPVAITVDFNLPVAARFLYRHNVFWHQRLILKRARLLQDLAFRFFT